MSINPVKQIQPIVEYEKTKLGKNMPQKEVKNDPKHKGPKEEGKGDRIDVYA